jgi:hypothetical protein
MLICSAAKYLDICAQTKNTLMVINTEWTWKMQGTLTERDGIVHFTPRPLFTVARLTKQCLQFKVAIMDF